MRIPRMSLQTITTIFAERKAIILDDHFVYAKKDDGWYHGYAYVNKDAIYPYREAVRMLCHEIALEFEQKGIQVVIAPTVGGVSLKDAAADYLGSLTGREILAVCADEEDVLEPRSMKVRDFHHIVGFAGHGKIEIHPRGPLLDDDERYTIKYFEKTDTRRVIKRGQNALIKGKTALIVEDIINSGKTVEKTKKAAEDAGVIVAGVGALCNRSGGKVTAKTLGVPELFSLLDLKMEMYKEEECPICKERGVESVRTDLGKGKEFLARIGKL